MAGNVVGSLWERRWLTTTRGRLLVLLRRANRTVDELAQALEMTDNAVRSQLALLERDGLVQQQGVRRGTRKPAFVFALTPEAERLFQKAYVPVLRQLLDTLASRLPAELEEVVLATGRSLAAMQPLASSDGDQAQRLWGAVELLNGLGGLAALEPTAKGEKEGEGKGEEKAGWRIHGYRCPLGEVVPSHPEMCHLTAALLSEVVGQTVEERCQRAGGVWSPQCCFVVPRSDAAS
jgi:predicted ArsR family transcriptional regulator